jgi:hypothetical protein
MDPDGDFVVAWHQRTWPGPDGTVLDDEIIARRFAASGQPRGEPFHVNQWTEFRQVKPRVAIDPDGDFVVVWQSWTNPGGNHYDVYARRYHVSGQPLSDEFRVNQNVYYRQQNPDVGMAADGSVVVAWEGQSGTGDAAIMLRRYYADGTPATDEVPTGFGTVSRPRMDVTADGAGVVVYGGVRAQRFAADLSLIGDEIRVNTLPRFGAIRPDVAVRADGGFSVTWDSQPNPQSATTDVYRREFGSDGVAQGPEVPVNRFTGSFNGSAAVAANPDGDSVIVWARSESGLLNVWGHRFANPPTVRGSSFEYDAAQQRVQFTFSEDVGAGLTSTALRLVNLASGQTIDPAAIELVWHPATLTATFGFPGLRGGVLPDGRYRATLGASAVTDPAANPMLTDATLDFFVLAGDADRDAKVDRRDLSVLEAHWQKSPAVFSDGDFDYNGVVDVNDLGILASRWQQGAATSPPAPSAMRRATSWLIDQFIL